MKKITFFILIAFTMISLANCSLPNSDTSDQPKKNIELTDPVGIIFSKDTLSYSPKNFSGIGIETKELINISKEEAKKADEIAKNCMQDKEGIIENIVRFYPKQNQAEEREFALAVLEKIEPVYSDYIRQYVGYESGEGNRLVWINFFLEDDADQDWRKVIIYPPLTSKRTDNHGFFEALIDLDSKHCLHFKLGV